eukprot:CAMPEP_0175939938 /NCGR_PEP_ID=MMETSP0108-20121206/23531_1 /TAXON_ID=195067 ORGANISM="Goniomonas pacifica, Strain CCMP1869" /NCGR_SAMPLE_ID=MMETSP0108 /ASSEMBLY_ACC=CAM_ASM_000204 /LENGTH=256 /DNA_ID=CAMNT_0017264359 /DNA_START=78 /DNA_END=845 /DNA_ORIENTATION=-
MNLATCYYNATWVQVGVSNAVALSIAQEQVKFTLDADKSLPAGEHPLLMEFGTMECEITAMPGKHTWFEMCLAIPELSLEGYDGHYNYQARSYLNKALGVMGDVVVEGYQAIVADVATNSTPAQDLSITPCKVEKKPVILHSKFTEGTGDFLPAEDMIKSNAGFAQLAARKDLQMMGVRKLAGSLVRECSAIAYDWSQTTVRSGVAGSVVFDQSPDLPAIKAGTRFDFSAQEHNAFEVKAYFHLTMPSSCPKSKKA